MSFVQNNGADILKLGAAGYVASQKIKLMEAQSAMAISGRAPVRTGYAVNPQTGQVEVTPIVSTMGAGSSSWLPSYPAANAYGQAPNYLMIAGAIAGILGLAFILKRK